MRFKEPGSGYIYQLGSAGIRNFNGENLLMWSLSSLTDGRLVSDSSEENIHRWIIRDQWVPVDEKLLSSPKFEELQEPEYNSFSSSAVSPFDAIRSYFK